MVSASYPLKPLESNPSADTLLERFLDYVASKNLTLYPAQEEAILELYEGKNIILATPTGSGKSLVAAAMHFRSASLGRRSVYTCPIKALVNEKFLSLCKDFGPDNVGMMTGDASVNRNAPILCCTAEILANIALREGPTANVQDVIMDEFHYYSDRDRGAAWQIPLLTLPQSQFLLISATLGDTRFFERELEKLTGMESRTIASKDRPVPLHYSYVEEPLLDTLSMLQEKERLPVYLVHFTQNAAADTAQNLTSVNFCSKAEKEALSVLLEEERFNSPFGKEIKKLLRQGIGLHHAGLLPKYRLLVEKLAQKGLLKVICGTDTLGVGVNVPIRTVLFTQLCKYSGDKTAILKARDFHQISGRAGRRGFDDVGYVISMAPEHVIENKKLAEKAAADPKKKKYQKKSPPEHGYVGWDERTFTSLQSALPEALEPRFKVSHGVLLNVLSRNGDGCRAMRDLINNCHQSAAEKKSLRKQAFRLFRTLLNAKIIEFISPLPSGKKLRLNVELQDDFSLNQTLSLYLIETLPQLDQNDPDYALKVLSLAESIVEDPDAILRKQLDKLKTEYMAEMKADGIEFEERIERLKELEYPKPEREFIYGTFNEFAARHPWVGQENIRPKSILREMFERYLSFADYIRLYGLQRAEGVLLRHLSNVHRILKQTIPQQYLNDALQEAYTYLDALLRTIDSSLLDEWQLLRDPNYKPATDLSLPERSTPVDITRDRKDFIRLCRNELFKALRHLANQDYQTLIEEFDCSEIFSNDAEKPKWLDIAIGEKMKPWFESHGHLRLDPAARSLEHTRTEEIPEEKILVIKQTLIDADDTNDWTLDASVNIAASRTSGKPQLKLIYLGPISQ